MTGTIDIDKPLSSAATAASEGAAESLDRDCFCISLDTKALKRALQADPETADLYQLIRDRCPHLFANLPVFISARHLDHMAAVIRAVETVVRLPAYRETVLGWAPPPSRASSRQARAGGFSATTFTWARPDPDSSR